MRRLRTLGEAVLPSRDIAGKPLSPVLRVLWPACLLGAGWLVVLPTLRLRREATVGLAVDLALAVGLLAALVGRRRIALELAGWVSLFCPLALLGYHPRLSLHIATASAVGPAILAFLLVARRRLFPAAPPRPRRPVAGAFRLTLALLVAAEIACRLVIAYDHLELLVMHEPPSVARRAAVPGHPTVVTLGSSPANTEEQHNRPFSAILEERLGDRFNFLYYARGGLNTDLLLGMADDLLAGDRPPAGIILYAGFQDLNQFAGLSLLRRLDPAGRSATIRGVVRWVVEHSSLVRLALYELWWSRQRILSAPSAERAALVLDRYRANIERLVALAEARRCRVVAVTLAIDRVTMPSETVRYVDAVNEFLLGLPARHPSVVVVDFGAEMDRRYPAGRLPSCEPYEAAPGTTRCGALYHLGPRGHEILAGMLESVLAGWSPP